jgi:hypothetical protein
LLSWLLSWTNASSNSRESSKNVAFSKGCTST